MGGKVSGGHQKQDESIFCLQVRLESPHLKSRFLQDGLRHLSETEVCKGRSILHDDGGEEEKWVERRLNNDLSLILIPWIVLGIRRLCSAMEMCFCELISVLFANLFAAKLHLIHF